MIAVSVVITYCSKWITKNGAQPQNNGIVLKNAEIKKEARSQGKESNKHEKAFYSENVSTVPEEVPWYSACHYSKTKIHFNLFFYRFLMVRTSRKIEFIVMLTSISHQMKKNNHIVVLDDG